MPAGNPRPPWGLHIHTGVKKRLARLQPRECQRILATLQNLADDPFAQDLKPLRGEPLWRLRVGGWRVLVEFDAAERIIYVLDFGSRGGIYKK